MKRPKSPDRGTHKVLFEASETEYEKLSAYCYANKLSKTMVLRKFLKELPDCRLEAPQPSTVSTEVQNA